MKYVLSGKPEQAVKYTRKVIKQLKDDKIKVSDLIITVQLTKPISEYKVRSPHVTAAKKIKDVKGGTMIKFVIVKGKGSISERARLKASIKQIDKEYYINKQIIPSALRVLSMFGIKESDLHE